MVVVQINITMQYGSTGKIVKDIDYKINSSGNNGYVACMFSIDTEAKNVYSTKPKNYHFQEKKEILISRLSGRMGYRNKRATKKMTEWIESKHPDVIHLHNIHGNWLNLKVLFDFINEKKYAVVWTLHDCWSFTGRCSNFESVGCNKWKTGCYSCEKSQKSVYPITYFFDFSKKMWNDKKDLFSKLENTVLVTPSDWLKNYVKQSFLGKYKIYTVHNGINLNLFRPVRETSEYLTKVENKKIILGVANSWTKMKGLDDFLKLNNIIDREKYCIVLIGLNKKQLQYVPDSILKIGRTKNQEELVKIYSQADVFVNLTYQDNYPTTNLEATACGTPVLTYQTGGSVESVFSKDNIIAQGNIEAVWERIQVICNGEKEINKFRKIAEKYFDRASFAGEYMNIYNEVLKNEHD